MKTYKIFVVAAAIIAASLSDSGTANAVTNVPVVSDQNANTVITPAIPDSPSQEAQNTGAGLGQVNTGAPEVNEQSQTLPAKAVNITQNRGSAIENRIAILENMLARVKSMTKISDDKKTAITEQIEASITKLTEMKDKLIAAKDSPTGLGLGGSKIASNRIYSLGVPQAFAMGAIERIDAVATALETLAKKLQTFIGKAKDGGANTDQMENDLGTINTNIAQARELAQSAGDIVSELGTEDEKYSENREKLLEASKYIKNAGENLRSAREAANHIGAALKKLSENTTTK